MKSSMKTIVFFSISTLSVLSTTIECSTCNDEYPISDIINSLSSELSKKFNDRGNYFYSPLSLSVALAMIYQGAQGPTKHQMTEALKYRLASDGCVAHEVGKGFKDLLSTLDSNDHYRLLVANAAFVQQGYNILPNYTSKLRSFFDAQVEHLDFANEAEQSLDKVNEWVEYYTNGHIVKLLSEPLDRSTVMILLNAIYFKGMWNQEFRAKNFEDSFCYFNGTSKNVTFMYQQEMLKYYNDSDTDYSFLELDYAGDDISMLIALPHSCNKFPDLDMNSETLCHVRSSMTLQEVVVSLPKFKMEYQRELSKIMINMGMTELFTDRADLTGIGQDLHVSLLVHKALIEVNEQGTEAAAVSGVGIDSRRRPARQIHFWASHAFQFWILDKRSNAILFSGRLTDPVN